MKLLHQEIAIPSPAMNFALECCLIMNSAHQLAFLWTDRNPQRNLHRVLIRFYASFSLLVLQWFVLELHMISLRFCFSCLRVSHRSLLTRWELLRWIDRFWVLRFKDLIRSRVLLSLCRILIGLGLLGGFRIFVLRLRWNLRMGFWALLVWVCPRLSRCWDFRLVWALSLNLGFLSFALE